MVSRNRSPYIYGCVSWCCYAPENEVEKSRSRQTQITPQKHPGFTALNIAYVMFFLALAILNACVILARYSGDLGYQITKWRGNLGKPRSQIRDRNRGPAKSSTPRGVGGEGRVRNWWQCLCYRFSFVHVFSGYVASLSITIINNDL